MDVVHHSTNTVTDVMFTIHNYLALTVPPSMSAAQEISLHGLNLYEYCDGFGEIASTLCVMKEHTSIRETLHTVNVLEDSARI